MAEYSKKLHIRKSGTVTDIKLYTTTSEVGTNYLSFRDGSTTVYAKLGATSDSNASALRVRKSGTTYAVLTQASLSTSVSSKLAGVSNIASPFTIGIKSNGTVISNSSAINTATSSWTNISDVYVNMPYGVIYGIKTDGTLVRANGSNPNVTTSIIDSWTGIKQLVGHETCLFGLKTDGTIVYNGTYTGVNGPSVSFVPANWTNLKYISVTPIDVDSGYYALIGIKNDGTLMGCGWQQTNEFNFTGLTNVVQVCAGYNCSAFLQADGTVAVRGAMGLDTSSWTGITKIAMCTDGLVGLKSDGTLVKTGGMILYSVSGITNVKDIYTFSDWGDQQALAYEKTDGTVTIIGNSSYYNQTSFTIT